MKKRNSLEAFPDSLSNQPKNDQPRQTFRELLRQKFEEHLPDTVERIWNCHRSFSKHRASTSPSCSKPESYTSPVISIRG